MGRSRRAPLILLATLAVAALLGGRAWSAGAAGAVSVVADVQPRALVLGRGVAVAGRVSSGRAGEVVLVEQNPCGRGWSYIPPVRAETDAGGSFLITLDVNSAPVANTSVRVRWGRLHSTPIALRVRPTITIRPFWGKVRIEVNGQLAADLVARNRHAVLEGRRPGGLWRRLGSVPLRLRDTPFGEIPVGLVGRPRGYAFVRAFLPAAQAAPCYASTRSPSLGL
jgi:hypothetical protein